MLLSNGTLPPVSQIEFNSHLQHALTVLEIVCLESDLNEFDSISWHTAREYDNKILQDISQGFKRWETLDQCIDSTAWTYAQKMTVKSKGVQNQNQNKGQNGTQKLCTTFNTFRKEGCSFEHNNPGEKCIFLHHCSTCRQKGFPNRKHKAIHCKGDDNSNSTNLTFNSSAAPAPPVTSV